MRRHKSSPGGSTDGRSGPRTTTRAVVLVVDDNDDNRDIYATGLRHADVDVFVACDGAEALAVAAKHVPDVVVMDLEMPVMDGFEAIRRLRADPSTKDTYIIVLSGFVDRASRRRAVEVGCDEYLAKPLLPRDLAERVRAVLTLRRAQSTGVRRRP